MVRCGLGRLQSVCFINQTMPLTASKWDRMSECFHSLLSQDYALSLILHGLLGPFSWQFAAITLALVGLWCFPIVSQSAFDISSSVDVWSPQSPAQLTIAVPIISYFSHCSLAVYRLSLVPGTCTSHSVTGSLRFSSYDRAFNLKLLHDPQACWSSVWTGASYTGQPPVFLPSCHKHDRVSFESQMTFSFSFLDALCFQKRCAPGEIILIMKQKCAKAF